MWVLNIKVGTNVMFCHTNHHSSILFILSLDVFHKQPGLLQYYDVVFFEDELCDPLCFI